MTSKVIRTTILLLSLLTPAEGFSHGQWLDLSDFYPGKGTKVEAGFCGGHHYPECSFAVKESLLHRAVLRAPGGEEVDIELTRSDRSWNGSFSVETGGAHIVSVSLQRKGAPLPNYELKAILVADGGKDDLSDYSIGSGLEIVPAGSLSEASPGGDLPVYFLIDGEKTGARIEVLTGQGKRFTLDTGEDGEPALLRGLEAGKYLLIAESGGRGCSLVFRIADEEKQ